MLCPTVSFRLIPMGPTSISATTTTLIKCAKQSHFREGRPSWPAWLWRLALSDSHADLAPEGAPGLDSLFLDEGFGTLDPETLDVTAAAIEELGASGRMVAIVTHIRELAERMPLRFEVTKSPTTSTVTRVTA